MVTNSSVNGDIKNRIFNAGLDVAVRMSPLLSKSTTLRYGVLQTGKFVSSRIRPANPLLSSLPPGTMTDVTLFGDAFIKTFDRILARRLSGATLRSIAHNLIHGALVQGGEQSAIAHFVQEFGINPPSTLTISPGKTCNLQCTGCYASAGPTAEKLDW